MEIAHIKWFDAQYTEGPDYVAGLDPGIIIESAGVLISSDADHVTIVGDWWDSYPSARCRHIHHIPNANILEMHTSDVADMKKRRIKRGGKR